MRFLEDGETYHIIYQFMFRKLGYILKGTNSIIGRIFRFIFGCFLILCFIFSIIEDYELILKFIILLLAVVGFFTVLAFIAKKI